MPERIAPLDPIYQLKITLLGVRPAVWRQVLIPAKFRLLKVHKIIQAAMGWKDYHLHQFVIGGLRYSYPYPGTDWGDSGDISTRNLRARDLWERRGSVVEYIYDLGDDWHHSVVLEKILPAKPDGVYPVCLAGARACPPEDVGGVSGYREFRDVLRRPKHRDHADYVAWSGGSFNPDLFDLVRASRTVYRIR